MSVEDFAEERQLELMKLYAPRCPMTQLPKRYRVTKKNPDPPLLHFAFPDLDDAVNKCAEKVLRTHYNLREPFVPSLRTPFTVAELLSAYVEYDLEAAFPFEITSDCSLILVLYTNYTMKGKKLIEEDEEDVIRMVQKALGYDKSVRPKWCFDCHDTWEPGDDEDGEGTNWYTPSVMGVHDTNQLCAYQNNWLGCLTFPDMARRRLAALWQS